ncbi:predicted protein [Lichtheimia corymbifera JMRC:FSU:9682]|uniref:Uncharacterized protein n=1 Tax=Lichtheimia corymbifera JMRC:FSU:9682 TaxID=1263082 RepID=A0A068SA97_9FUNG|nr:predicted protein [Lichtheimia corymbifera JMRC:FSU:9682]
MDALYFRCYAALRLTQQCKAHVVSPVWPWFGYDIQEKSSSATPLVKTSWTSLLFASTRSLVPAFDRSIASENMIIKTSLQKRELLL